VAYVELVIDGYNDMARQNFVAKRSEKHSLTAYKKMNLVGEKYHTPIPVAAV
jgi:hypothetical protein